MSNTELKQRLRLACLVILLALGIYLFANSLRPDAPTDGKDARERAKPD